MALIDNLVSYYKFDENTGSTVADSVNGHDGTWQGTLGSQWTTGKINSGGSFNGSDNSVSVTNHTDLQFTGDFSISFWAYQTTTSAGGIDIVRKESSNNGYGIETYGVTTYNYTAGWKNGSAYGWSKTLFTLTQNTWVHIVLVKSGTTLSAYKNGTFSDSLTGGSATIGTSTADLLIGTFSSGNEFPGRLDEMGFWNRALTTDEITSLYNSGAGLTYPFSVVTPNSVEMNSTDPDKFGWVTGVKLY